MVEAAEGLQDPVERILPGMAERGVAKIVRQRQRLGEILVETERAADRARDLRDLQAMGQPGPVMIALVVHEYLRLVLQPSKGGRVDDAVPVPLEGRSAGAFRLRME